MAMFIATKGSELTSLLPTDVRHWWPIIEDVFTSTAVQSLSAEVLEAFCASHEFGVVTLDATIKCCMGIMGQESYRAPKKKRDAAPFDDNAALRRVLTVRGRTGAVLAMIAALREGRSSDPGSWPGSTLQGADAGSVRCLRLCLNQALHTSAAHHAKPAMSDA